jgi:hypothetical protein
MALVAWLLAGMSAQARSLVPPDGQSKHVRDAAGIGRLQRHVSKLLSLRTMTGQLQQWRNEPDRVACSQGPCLSPALAPHVASQHAWPINRSPVAFDFQRTNPYLSPRQWHAARRYQKESP